VDAQRELMASRCAGTDRFSIPHLFGYGASLNVQQFATELEARETPFFFRDYHSGFASNSPVPPAFFTNLGRQLPDGNRLELRRFYRSASPQYNVEEEDIFLLRELAPDGTLRWQEDVEHSFLQDVALYDLFRVGPGNVALLGVKNGQLWYYRQHCAPPTTAACADNLLQNPGFETGNATGWQTSGQSPNASAGVAPYPYSGNHAFLLRESTVSQRVLVTPGSTYLLRAIAKAEKADRSAYLRVNFFGNTGPVGSNTEFVTSLDFKGYDLEIVLPENAAYVEILATTVGTGHLVVDDFCLVKTQSVGTDNELSTTALRWFPNPASQSLTLDFSASNTDAHSIALFNAVAIVVVSKTVAPNGPRIETLDLSGLPSGQYVARIALRDGSMVHRKVVVLR